MVISTTTNRPIYEIAGEIKSIWSKVGSGVNFAAKPYLVAMLSLENKGSMYGCDDAKSIIMYFLSNANTFRGPEAKALKAELKKIVGIK